MSDTLTESVARLYRAGSEHSQQAQKLREAVNELLTWLSRNLPRGFELPCHCEFWTDNGCIGLRQCRDESKTQGIFVVELGGKEHTRYELLQFSKLIADGFLDKLSEKLESEAVTFQKTSEQVGSFIVSK